MKMLTIVVFVEGKYKINAMNEEGGKRRVRKKDVKEI